MSDHCYLSLYTKNPDDLPKVVDFAREVSGPVCLDVTDKYIYWVLESPDVDYEELTRKIVRQFPQIAFVLVFDQPKDLCWTEFEWDGNDWVETGWYSDYEEVGTENEKSFVNRHYLEYGPPTLEDIALPDLQVDGVADEELPF